MDIPYNKGFCEYVKEFFVHLFITVYWVSWSVIKISSIFLNLGLDMKNSWTYSTKIMRKSLRKPGRPPKRNPMDIQLSIRVPNAASDRLKRLAAEKRLPVATLVRNHLLDWLESLEQ